MSWLNLPSLRRAPNRRTRDDDGSFEYESRPSEVSHDTEFQMSQDGRRGHHVPLNVGPKKRKISPSDLVDSYREWVPLPGDRGVEEEEEAGVPFDAQPGEKRQRYESSDEPMVPWRRLMDTFMQELVRRHGLADALDEKACPCCKTPHTRETRRFRCTECGTFVQCLKCVLERHACHPLHRIREWSGTYWVPILWQKLA
ncbi:hypothetical protein C8R46DRAFT_1238678 [Mycena filopes]|nr:hypothetical protein C8R46DRAFT_1238678 [Mycena filopes]